MKALSILAGLILLPLCLLAQPQTVPRPSTGTALSANVLPRLNATATNFSAMFQTGTTNSPFVVRNSNGVPFVVVSTNGNTGIGTASPTNTIDVNGHATLRSNVFVGKLAAIGGGNATDLNGNLYPTNSTGLGAIWNVIAPTNTVFVAGTRYTNTTSRYEMPASSWTLNGAVAGTAIVALYVEHSASTNRLPISAGPLASLTVVDIISGLIVGPGDVFHFENETSGTGASVAVVPNTCSRQQF